MVYWRNGLYCIFIYTILAQELLSSFRRNEMDENGSKHAHYNRKLTQKWFDIEDGDDDEDWKPVSVSMTLKNHENSPEHNHKLPARKMGHPESVSKRDASKRLDELLIQPKQHRKSQKVEIEISDPKVLLDTSRCKFWKKCLEFPQCNKEPYPLDDDLINDPRKQCKLYFKILAMKSFQLFTASTVTLGFQLSWKYEDGKVIKASPIIEFVTKYYWTAYISLACFIIFKIDMRCQIKKVYLTSFLVYLIQTANIVYLCFICGLVWEFVMAPVITMTLCLVYLLLAIAPLTVENGSPTTKSRIQLIATTFTFILSLFCWYLILGILAYFQSTVAHIFSVYEWYHITIFYWFPSFLIAELLCMIEVYELRRLFEGNRIPLTEKSWLFAAVYL